MSICRKAHQTEGPTRERCQASSPQSGACGKDLGFYPRAMGSQRGFSAREQQYVLSSPFQRMEWVTTDKGLKEAKTASVPWLVWLSWLECRPINQNIKGSVPTQGTYK